MAATDEGLAATDDLDPVMRTSHRLKGSLGMLAVLGGALVLWYINQPVPDEVSLESAVADVATTESPAKDPTETTDPSAAITATKISPDLGVEGTWIVDTTIGDFSFEDATSSFVGFRIDEELARIGASTAVGRTPAVRGSLTLAGTEITETVIEADLSRIVTNQSRRDRAVQRALATATHPIATFILSEPIQLGVIPVEGVAVSATAVGTLEIKGVTRPIEIQLETQLVGDLIVVVGAVDITFAVWGVEMPTAPGVVSVEDHGILEIQLFLSRG